MNQSKRVFSKPVLSLRKRCLHLRDLRDLPLFRPGDTVNIQVKELTERERKIRCKKYPKLDEFEFNYTCLLAYTGDYRPRGPNMKPKESPELKVFLEQKGMNVEEFEQMRNLSEENSDDAQDDEPRPPGTGSALPTSTSSKTTTTALPQTSVQPPLLGTFPPPLVSFPPPTSDRVMWHLDLPGGMLVLHPGEQHHDGDRDQDHEDDDVDSDDDDDDVIFYFSHVN